MAEERERTLDELRKFGQAGRRADLLEAAWLAGNTNVAELARAANITRAWAYRDLASRGIYPKQDRPEGERPMQIEVAGFTGTQPEKNRILQTGNQEEAAAWAAATFHNQHLLPAKDELEQEERRVQAVRRRFDTLYEALSTAENWLAAHHAFVRTGYKLEEAAQRRDDAQRALDDIYTTMRPPSYDELVPLEDQIIGSCGIENASEIASLVRERRRTAAATAKLVAGAQ